MKVYHSKKKTNLVGSKRTTSFLKTSLTNKKRRPFLIGFLMFILVGAAVFLWAFQPHTSFKPENLITPTFPDFIYSFRAVDPQYEGDHATYIYRYDLNNKQEKYLFTIPTTKTRFLFRIELSPDGKKIAYSVSEDSPSDNKQLWVINSDGTNPKMVYQSNNSAIAYLTWSPDSKNLIFYDNASSPQATPYMLSLDTGTVKKMNLLAGTLEGWFSNNKLGFTEANPTNGTCGESHCFPTHKATLTDFDGSKPQVYDPVKNDISTRYFWLKDGTGLIKANQDGLTHYDFSTKKEVKISEKSGIDLMMFPKSKSAILLRGEKGGRDIYRLDLSTNKLTKIKTLTGYQADLKLISDDEKYFLVSYRIVDSTSGFTTDEGIMIYDMNGNLMKQAPLTYYHKEPIGFVK
ncbi:MAG: PD40 domain-containing protein [Candidatus Levybacteria bacterium]|nr:PD40 domain-containing protein [Candidatus Levybacteria bacterium]